MKRFLVYILIITIFINLSLTVKCEGEEHLMKKEYYYNMIKSESEYIKSLVLSNGAIGMNKPSFSSYTQELPETDGVSPDVYVNWKSIKVVPYFSLAACRGLIMTSQATDEDMGSETVLNFINWYINHMNTADSDINNVAGTVYDYFIFENPADGQIVEVTLRDAYATQYKTKPSDNPYDYDSTDSYAALFLEVLYDYTKVFDNDFLNDKKELVAELVNVIMATYVPKLNLTGAKPNYMVCYLMDNCEVYRGLESAADIYKDYIKDDAARTNVLETAEKIKNAIMNNFWSDKNKAFTAGVFADGTPGYNTDAESLLNFYPQASSQMFPIVFGLLNSSDEKAILVYERFTETYCQDGVSKKNWIKLDHSDPYPWVILLRGVLAMGDYERASLYIKYLYNAYKSHTSYFYYNAEAGQFLLVLAELYNLAEADSTKDSSDINDSSDNDASINISQQEQSKNESKPSKSGLYLGIGTSIVLITAAVVTIIMKNRKKGIEK